MARLSNPQVLMFVEIGAANGMSDTISGWLGRQRIGQGVSLVRDRIAAYRGVITHTMGDTVFCSFASSANALSAAREINEHFAANNHADRTSIPLGVSIAVAKGQLNVDAGKVSGEVVDNVGAMLDVAISGQVLVSRSVWEEAVTREGVGFQEVRARDYPDTLYRLRLESDTADQDQVDVVDIDIFDLGLDTRSIEILEGKADQSSGPGLFLTYAGEASRWTGDLAEVTVGRAPENQVVIHDKHVSRKHLRFVFRDDHVDLEVLSQNGACVRFQVDGVERQVESTLRLRGSGSVGLAPMFSLAGDNVIDFRVEGD